MNSRLKLVLDWKLLAQQARYRPMKLAKLCRASLRQLQRFIRIKFQNTLRAWLDRLRLDRAIELLAKGKPVKAVAGEIGLKQPTYFFRFFKRASGTTPAAYFNARTPAQLRSTGEAAKPMDYFCRQLEGFLSS